MVPDRFAPPHDAVATETTPRSLHQVLGAARQALIEAGVHPDEARLDVDVFAGAILGWDRARLLAERRAPAPGGLEPRFSEWVSRRRRHEPTAYIVGVREFWGLEFVVSPAVLIPRPCTELIVEEAVARLGADPALRVAEIGTGSGCIAVSVTHTVPGARVIATDVSGDALAVARANAARHGVADRVTCIRASYLDGVTGTFDLLLANPPYVRGIDRAGLGRAVRHEPDVALFGGATGLEAIGAVLQAASRQLTPGGWLVMEFGDGQEADVRRMLDEVPGLHVRRVRADLQGIPRTMVIQRA
ncbi:MAG: peptide chain release factor N(5)-glutamine methyltransferase [Acidimicrobiia bacterium]|nr:peptide chain release factor N(5)-glutamine methyltransferase [Acidimicrobiia bacterium]